MKEVIRETHETRVRVALEIALAGDTPAAAVATGEPFLDHMLAALARHAQWALEVEARGDLRHHLIEDVALTLGRAVLQAAPATVQRHADRTVAMDDALVQCVVDFGGRPYYRGPLPARLYDHWMRSFADEARCTLHLRVLRGRDRHHVIEAAFKALGLALRDALAATDSAASTKGAVRWTVR